MVSLAERRRGADHLEAEHGVSERRACQVVGIARSTKRRPSGRIEEARLVRRIHELSERYPRWGYRKIHGILRTEGTAIGRDRLRLIRKREGLQVARKARKRRRPGKSTTTVDRALYPNHVWSYDFVEDRIERGRKLRMLVVIDEFTRESLAIEVAWSFMAERVVEVLQYLFAVRGAPEHLRSDNGPEFVAQAVTRWLDRAGVVTLFIAKGSPWENGYVESFNSRFRDELLDRELFLSLADARWVVDRWRLDYNHHRPHSSLDYQTPAAFAARCAASAPERASATPQLSPPLQQHSGPSTQDSLIHTGT